MTDEYTARINRVLDHIERHLAEALTLDELARVASFSPFHFHRIFRALRGETLASFIQRLRLERAASQLIHNPRKTVTEVALDCGFSSPSVFARAFRAQFGTSASEWRSAGGASKPGEADRKDGQANRKACEERFELSSYLHPERHRMTWRIEMNEKKLTAEVKVEELPELEVVYLRHVGPYQGDAALFGRLWGRLLNWAIPRGLFRPPETTMLTVYHDDPEITEGEKLRLSVCLSVPRETLAEGEVGRMTVAGGRYAVARFELRSDQFGDAWNAVYGAWLPQSGYQPDDRPPFEVCRNNPEEHPEGKHLVDICVPVRPL